MIYTYTRPSPVAAAKGKGKGVVSSQALDSESEDAIVFEVYHVSPFVLLLSVGSWSYMFTGDMAYTGI
jgi:hypothetical protein